MKKFLSILLTIAIVISVCAVPTPAYAATNLTDCAINYGDYQFYTGAEIKPKVKVFTWIDDSKEVVYKEGRDYTVEYKNNVKVGTGTIIIKGKAPYMSGKLELPFTIDPAILDTESKDIVITYNKHVTYNSSGKYNYNITVKHKGKKLTEGKDYTVINNVPEEFYTLPDIGTIAVRGEGNYTGEVSLDVTVDPISIAPAKITLRAGDAIPNRGQYEDKDAWIYPEDFFVSLNGQRLDPSIPDYTLKKVKSTDSKLVIRAEGEGIYSGKTKDFEFALKPEITYVVFQDEYYMEKIGEDIEMPVYLHTGKQIKPQVAVCGYAPDGDVEIKENVDYTVEYKNNVSIGKGEVIVKGKGKYTGEIREEFKIIKNPGNTRISGNDRYETATKIADKIKTMRSGKKFKNIVVATGTNYPDALAGTRFAIVKNAPILISAPSKEQSTIDYIKNNLDKNGTVYILGGSGALPTTLDNKLNAAKIKNTRLEGKTRYETNLKILNSYDEKSNLLIVVTGANYPDALSASAVNSPILLVGSSLSKEQKEFLKKKKFDFIAIIGGKSVVSDNIKTELSSYAKNVFRVEGRNRYETSAQVASRFFRDSKTMVLAIGTNFPDALTGGPLAVEMGAPMVLTSSNKADYAYAKNYKNKVGIQIAVVLGGPQLISNAALAEIMK